MDSKNTDNVVNLNRRAALFNEGVKADLENELKGKVDSPSEVVDSLEMVLCRSIVSGCREFGKLAGECLAKKLSKWLLR